MNLSPRGFGGSGGLSLRAELLSFPWQTEVLMTPYSLWEPKPPGYQCRHSTASYPLSQGPPTLRSPPALRQSTARCIHSNILCTKWSKMLRRNPRALCSGTAGIVCSSILYIHTHAAHTYTHTTETYTLHIPHTRHIAPYAVVGDCPLNQTAPIFKHSAGPACRRAPQLD